MKRLLVLAWIVQALAGLATGEHACSGHVEKESCLTAGPCMFIELDSAGPSGGSRCLPCEMEGIDMPCPPVGSVFALEEVKTCTMQCGHQKIVSKVGPCEDTSGEITLAQCFARGTSGLSKCMWTQYNLDGKLQGACGPCAVMGIGTIPCVSAGMAGPVAGSLSTLCMSQCDPATACPPMLPGCSPTDAPAPPAPSAFPASAFKIATSDDAPDYFATKVEAPYGVEQYEIASRTAAQAAGWAPDTKQAPSVPVSIWGPPPMEGPTVAPGIAVMYGPAPPGMIGVPPPGYGAGTAPPPGMVEAAKAQSFLSVNSKRLRLRNRL